MLRLATIRTPDGTRAVRLDDEGAVETGHADVGALLGDPDWRELVGTVDGPRHALDSLTFETLVPQPDKVICVGLNYRDHIAEMGNEVPDYPTLFAKFPRSLTGAYDDIELPPESTKVDWEAELTVVIGATPEGSGVRRATTAQAAAAIAGYTVANDVSMRDFQRRTKQFLAGKMWERATPVGPWLTVIDDANPAYPISASIETSAGTETMQSSNTDQLLFGPVALVEYISQVITLVPGDLILTGTPGGVGAGRTPPRFVQSGETVVITIEGVGELRNRFTAP